MEFLPWLLIPAGLILAILLGCPVVGHLRRRGGGDWFVGLLKAGTSIPIRFFWRARYVGFDQLPKPPFKHGLIIVSNHCSGLDPALIECGVDFPIRWMMWRRMMVRGLGFLWRHMRVIPVDLSSKDRSAVRESIDWLRAGGAIGIFPEGGIERPAKHIKPFQPGVGFLVAKARSPVLLIHISGIPATKNAYTAIFRPCRARIEVIGLVEYPEERDLRKITEDLRERIGRASGWPLDEEPVPGTESAASVVPSERE